MIKKLYFSAVILVFLSGTTYSQESVRCGTPHYMERLKAEDPDLESRMARNEVILRNYSSDVQNQRTASTIITIPVVFHILYRNSTQNISQSRILDQLAVLNADYARLNADTTNTPAPFKSLAGASNVRFCLAQRDPAGNATTGIIRKLVTATGYDPISNDAIKFSSQGGDDAWPTTDCLNVWVANFNGFSNSILGISQMPGGSAATDGCCVRYESVGGSAFPGTMSGFNYGRTLTHEVGHWLALYHTWGDDGGSCTGSDNVNDTPNQSAENYNCPTFPLLDNCAPNSPGVMFMSYMDYVNDNCMNMFSIGQTNRLYQALTILRPTVQNSDGCLAPVGMEEITFATEVSVYPNPSTGFVTLTGNLRNRTNMVIRVSNMLGEMVYSRELKNAAALKESIDLSGLVPGVYTISLTADQEMINKKLLLTHN